MLSLYICLIMEEEKRYKCELVIASGNNEIDLNYVQRSQENRISLDVVDYWWSDSSSSSSKLFFSYSDHLY